MTGTWWKLCVISMIWRRGGFCDVKVTQSTSHSNMSEYCSEGWIDSPESRSCLRFSIDELPWHEARKSCQHQSADIVKIINDKMNSFIGGFIDPGLKSHTFYIGLHDRSEENLFVWLDESTPATYVEWSYGEPNNIHEEDCTQIGWGRGNSNWNDVSCSLPLRYICEKPYEVVITTPIIPPTDSSTKVDPSHSSPDVSLTTERHETEAIETEAIETKAIEPEAIETEAIETEAVETEAIENSSSEKTETVDGGISPSSVVGIVLGSLAAVIFLVSAIVYGCHRQKKRTTITEMESGGAPSSQICYRALKDKEYNQ